MVIPKWAKALRDKVKSHDILEGLRQASKASPVTREQDQAQAHAGARRNGARDAASADAFAAAWIMGRLAGGESLEDILVAACSEGGCDAVADAAALRAAARAAAAAAAASGAAGPGAAAAALAALCRELRASLPAPAPLAPHDGYLHGAPKPACHAARVRTADAVDKMRATRDGEIESMLRLLCTVFETDSATCALLTGDCIYIVGGCGRLWPCVCPDRWGFCGWSFLNSVHELLVVEDLDADARFAANYFVVDPQFSLKFYVAAPLVSTDGHRLGTLCVMGNKAQRFDATRAQVLANLAEMMVRQLEKRWAQQLEQQSDVGAALQRLRPLSAYDTPYLVVDTAASPWRILHMNVPAIEALGADWSASYEELALFKEGRARARFEGRPISDIFDVSCASAEWKAGGWEFSLGGVWGAPGGALEGRHFSLHFRLSSSSEGLDAAQPLVGIPSFVSLGSDNFGRSLFFVRVEEEPAPALVRLGGAPAPAAALGGAGVPAGDAAAAVGAAGLGVLGRGDSAEHLPVIRAGGGWSAGAGALGGARGAGKLLGDGCPIPGLLLGPLLGRGSYGRVYRGILKGQPVAAKIIDSVQLIMRDASGDPLEVALTRGLGHPNLMAVVNHAFSDASAAPGSRGGSKKAAAARTVCWMVFEHCDRGTIADAVVKGWFRTDRDPTVGATNLRQVALTALEVAGAMAYLHKHGVVHGDLCGGNVMLQSSPLADGEDVDGPFPVAKVGDFGLCRRLSAPGERLRLGSDSYGTVTHVAPEVLMEGAITQASDVYSFGVMLHEMLTGSRAWAGLSHTAVVLQLTALGRGLEAPAGLPAALDSLLRRCLARDPASRPAFSEAAAELAEWLQATRGQDLTGTPVGRRAPEAEAGAGAGTA